ncbi:hypothetical protein BD410DRAFT_14399 [Rickenella mellea]|uniref:DUF6593 domain-containing protein n=1 Tax=Rickenella mellea TaxID=50990 RepID=A0A4R5XDZ5_9AGAM|nr:hypothetical protein BD410DRAFT_14399 [Rickenella mellea]
MTNVLSWTSDDPRQSQLFNSYGPMYRFQTDESRGQRVTTITKSISPGSRGGRDDKVAKLEWAPNGGLGRAIIGKSMMSMVDLVKPDPRNFAYRTFSAPDGQTYRWRPGGNVHDVVLQDPYGNVIAFVRPVRPTRYPLGDVYAELHFVSPSVTASPPMMDAVTVSAMLYRFCMAFGA